MEFMMSIIWLCRAFFVWMNFSKMKKFYWTRSWDADGGCWCSMLWHTPFSPTLKYLLFLLIVKITQLKYSFFRKSCFLISDSGVRTFFGERIGKDTFVFSQISMFLHIFEEIDKNQENYKTHNIFNIFLNLKSFDFSLKNL